MGKVSKHSPHFFPKEVTRECAPSQQRDNPRDRRDGIQGIYKLDGNKSSGLEG